MTSHPYQTEVDIQVYQGDDEDALKNILVGDFSIEGLTAMEDANEILCRMRLDLDGILEVAAVEKRTGKSKHIRIANALRAKSAEEIAAGRKRIQELYETRGEMADDEWETSGGPRRKTGSRKTGMRAAKVIEYTGACARRAATRKSRACWNVRSALLAKMHAEDREEAIDLHEKIAYGHGIRRRGGVAGGRRRAEGVAVLRRGTALTGPFRVAHALLRAASAFLSALASGTDAPVRARPPCQPIRGRALPSRPGAGVENRCPVCQARFRGGRICSRCGADLEPLMRWR